MMMLVLNKIALFKSLFLCPYTFHQFGKCLNLSSCSFHLSLDGGHLPPLPLQPLPPPLLHLPPLPGPQQLQQVCHNPRRQREASLLQDSSGVLDPNHPILPIWEEEENDGCRLLLLSLQPCQVFQQACSTFQGRHKSQFGKALLQEV